MLRICEYIDLSDEIKTNIFWVVLRNIICFYFMLKKIIFVEQHLREILEQGNSMRSLLTFFFIAFLIATSSLQSQKSLSILNFNINDYPVVSGEIFIYDDNIQPSSNFAPGDFTVTDNGIGSAIIDYSCPSQTITNQHSIAIAFDLGLRHYFDSASRFNYGKTVVGEIIKLINLGESHAAVTSFDMISYLNSDFTTDQNILLSSLTMAQPKSGSSIEAGLLYPLSGAMQIAKSGQHKKSIIVVTDGTGNINTSEIIQSALDNGISIYSVMIGKPISAELASVCSQTGGAWIDNVPIEKNPIEIAKDILSYTYGFKPCKITWKGEQICDDIHNIDISVQSESIAGGSQYFLPDENKPRINAQPAYLSFSSVVPLKSEDQYVKLYAKNGDVTVTKTTIAHPAFIILNEIGPGKGDPQTIKKDSSYGLSIRFSPTDSAIVFTKIEIESNGCFGNEIYITGGFPNIAPKEPTIELLTPVCGDVLIVGDNVPVTWTGMLPRDVIQLEYSIDNANTWDTLAKNVIGLEYDWLVPDRQSEECLVRAIQLWPNNIGRTIDLRHSGGVNSAFFNSDGTLVVTASSDTTAAIWNSNLGRKLFVLDSHTKPVLYAQFSPDDNFVITSSADSTAILWDANTGGFIRRFSGHTGYVLSARFGPDGSKIVTASRDKTVKVWDVNTGEIVKSFSPSNKIVKFATFDPTGNYILTADNSGIAKMWDSNTLESFKEFDTRFGNTVGNVVFADFNPDGSRIVAVSQIKKNATVWDVAAVDTLFSVTHNDDTTSNALINSASFYYHPINGNLLITSGVANARIWDADNGSYIPPPLSEHTSAVTSAVLNFDGSRYLTASWDSTAKIWNASDTGRSLPIDTTACAFTIAKTDNLIEDIDFGELPVSSIRDSLIDPFIVNRSEFGYDIRYIRIFGGDSDDFKIIEGSSPYFLDSLGKSIIELRFRPLGLGQRSTNIEIIVPGDTIIRAISGIGIAPDLQIVSSTIDFGDVEVGDFKDKSVSVLLQNLSDGPISISNIYLNNPDTLHFKIIEGGSPILLNSGEGLPVTIRFTPEYYGRKNGIIEFENDGNITPARVSVFGNGARPARDTATIRISDAAGAAGDIIQIPIYLDNVKSNIVNKMITGISAQLKFNSTLLEPLDGFEYDEILGSERTIALTLPVESENGTLSGPGGGSLLATLRFRVGLGNDTSTALKLENVIPIGPAKIALFTENGLFALQGYCTEGGNRLIDSEGRFVLMQNLPNPFSESTTIEFEVVESGNTKLSVINYLGEVVKILVDANLPKGRHSFQFKSSGLPSGVYNYILETPSRNTSMRMQIWK